MSKKLILACMAVAAFAAFVVLPATASATRLCETQSDDVTCNNIAVGSKITGHNVGNTELTTTSGATLVTCSTAHFTGVVTENGKGTVEGTIEGAQFTGTGASSACTSAIGGSAATVHTNIGNGTPWCVKTVAGEEDKFTVNGNACGKEPRSITFVLTTSIGTCKYNRTNAVTGGTYTTDETAGTSEDAVLTVTPSTGNEFTKEEGGVLCPSAGQLRMSITLQTEADGKTLYLKKGN